MGLSPDDAVYPVTKIALVLDALTAEGIPKEEALTRVHLSKAAIASPTTRVSLTQVINCYRYAAEHSRDPHFAYRTGLQFHVSAYGMYGFAILSSVNYRQTMQFGVVACSNLSLKCNLAFCCRCIVTLWVPFFLRENFRFHTHRRMTRRNMRLSSAHRFFSSGQ
jgi:hypothetical protein